MVSKTNLFRFVEKHTDTQY